MIHIVLSANEQCEGEYGASNGAGVLVGMCLCALCPDSE